MFFPFLSQCGEELGRRVFLIYSYLVSTKKDLEYLHLPHLFLYTVEDTIFNTACLNGGKKEKETEMEHIIRGVGGGGGGLGGSVVLLDQMASPDWSNLAVLG